MSRHKGVRRPRGATTNDPDLLDSGHNMAANFAPTPAELSIVTTIFAQADPQKLGVLTGDVAVRVFGGTKLQPTVLGEIWSIADEDNKGWLPKKGVAIAVRLMGWAQKGEKITPALVNKSGPLPTIEGITSVTQHNTAASVPRSPPPAVPLQLTAQDKAKFDAMFAKSGATNGLLSGEKARDIFVKSKLPNEKLLQIWHLADTQDRGALDSTDFAIGMYFIQGLMSGKLSFVPSALPPALYQQAGGSPSSYPGGVQSHMSGTSGSFSPLNPSFSPSRNHIQPQYTGQSLSKAPVVPARPSTSVLSTGPFATPQGNGHASQWDVSPSEKAKADEFFHALDTQQRGFIEGDVAVPFMLESKLPGEDLAQIWDLADVNNDGRLTRDGFAVAMHLIQKKLAGNDIPSVLPPSLMPPSMRPNNGSLLSSQPTEPVKDLFSWDDTPPPSASSPQPYGSNYSNALQPQQTGPKLTATASPNVPTPRDPFGSSAFSGFAAPHDLLDDDDNVGTSSSPLHDQSAEIGNAQNHLSSTNRSLETVKAERIAAEKTLETQAADLSVLQTQLSSARAAYETETKLLSTLKERLSSQNADIQKSKEEIIRAESDLSAVRVEKAEVEGSFLRDKEEARDLQRKMIAMSQQIEVERAAIEKSKKEAKQQKGLLAIARKQLSTKEAEKAKTQKEQEEADAELATVTKEREETETALANDTSVPVHISPERSPSVDSLTFAAGHVLPTSPTPTSPLTATNTGKSNNPFFERLVSSPRSSTPPSHSPFLPFAGTPVATPPPSSLSLPDGPSDAPKEDPFGFSHAFESKATTAPSNELSKVPETADTTLSTPKAIPYTVPQSNAPDAVASPSTLSESENFTTPPTTANSRSQTTSPAPEVATQDNLTKLPSLDVTASHFPPVENISIPEQLNETDLHSQLKEIEMEESDSDNDSDDEDEIPLATLAKSKNAENHISADVSGTSFDDVFGVDSTVTASPQHHAFTISPDVPLGPSANSGSAFLTSEQESKATSSVAGVNAFDEAMGKIPSSTSATPQFTFDSAFDDNFDFNTPASDSSFAPAPTLQNSSALQNGHSEGSKRAGFDDIFTIPAENNAPKVPPRKDAHGPGMPEAQSNANAATPSFEDAFPLFRSPPASDVSNPPAPTPRVPSHASSVVSPVQQPFVASSPSKVAAPSPHSHNAGAISPPPRERSPTPRVASPKPRPSTSSSKETNEKLKEPTVRHSKLSIRLPFGKKKKQSEPIPAPLLQQHLTPPIEEPPRNFSPAVDDDVEAVKQLTAMGFSRSQAVDTLEIHGYDVQKALNSLLGAQ